MSLKSLCLVILSTFTVYVGSGFCVTRHVILVTVDGMAAYHLNNPELEIPNMRALIDRGVWAESSETIFPSVTHPSHTTLTTGVPPLEHGVLNNRMRNRITGETFQVTNLERSQSIKVPTLFDAAKKKGLSTAAFFWPETFHDKAVDYNIPEVLDEHGSTEGLVFNSQLVDELKATEIPVNLFQKFYSQDGMQQAADALLAEAAAYVIRKYKPNFLAIHFLITDKIQHRYGPEHYLTKAALTSADTCIGILRKALHDAGIESDTTFVVTADHGFYSVYKQVNVYPVFQQAGLTDRITFRSEGWTTFVELKENFDRTQDLQRLNLVLGRLRKLPGIAKIVEPGGFHELGLPEYSENVHVPGQYMIIGAIDVLPISDPQNSSTAIEPRKQPFHGHGYLPGDPRMYPALILSGSGILQHKRIGHVRGLDIAPTICTLLNLSMDRLKGRVLEEAFQPAAAQP